MYRLRYTVHGEFNKEYWKIQVTPAVFMFMVSHYLALSATIGCCCDATMGFSFGRPLTSVFMSMVSNTIEQSLRNYWIQTGMTFSVQWCYYKAYCQQAYVYGCKCYRAIFAQLLGCPATTFGVQV